MARTRIYNVMELPSVCEAGATYFVSKGAYVEEYRTTNAGLPLPVGVPKIPDHIQDTPSTSWIVNHNTGIRRTLEFFSVGGVRIRGDVVIVSVNQTVGYFLEPTAGYAKVI